MDSKDVFLLGFLSNATSYLKNETNSKEKELEILNKINIDELKNRLSSLGNTTDENAILEAGKKAFEEMVGKKSNIISEFEDIFSNVKEEVKDIPSLSYFFNPMNELKENKPAIKKVDTEELDSILNEINKEEKPKEEEVKLPNEKTYVDGLIKTLNEAEKIENERIKNKISIFEKISRQYPYLSGGFIRAVFSLKETIANDNPYNEDIILLHRVYFRELDSLRHFVEIACNHNYTVNVDEDKMLVDVFKEFVNADGRIITNIFEIANQVKALDGEYDGYRVIEK